MQENTTSSLSDREKEIHDWLSTEYANIQTGRATAALIEKVSVEAYGAKTALSHCAAITTEDPKTLLVTPYDPTLLPEIEKALQKQTTAMSVAVQENNIRVIVPEMTEERRELLKKIIRERAEEARQSIRGAREKELGEIKKQKTDGTLSKDEEFTEKKKLQERVEEINKKIDEMQEKKLENVQG